MKRTAYIKDIIKRTNFALRTYGIANENESALFAMVKNLLRDKHMYNGFNYYIDKEFTHNGVTEIYPVLTTVAQREGYDNIREVPGVYVQFL